VRAVSRPEEDGALNQRTLWIVGIALALAATAARLHNAVMYPEDLGFDALGNWQYIHRLMGDWTLPAPGDGWATSHPPFFYYLGAVTGRLLGSPDKMTTVIAVRVLSTLTGLGMAVLAGLLVQRVAPGDTRRALLAGALIFVLPVHIYTSAMLNEEILAATLVSIAITGAALELLRPSLAGPALGRAALIGVAAGLALLTKLSGLLVIAAVGGAYFLLGLRRRSELPRATACAALFTVVALLVGGWYYARNLERYGYIYPKDLQVHSVMFEMPPGERSVSDYLRFPLATFSDPQLLAPDLLHSVWGSTYATLWFDGHRHFLPRSDLNVRRAGTLILLLALLPSVAFVAGALRGLVRALRGDSAVDTALLLLVALSLAGYVLFTWRNPWYATLKAGYLLGCSVPFAFYSSEALAEWTRPGRRSSLVVWIALVALAVAVLTTFTFDLVFLKAEGPGLPWRGFGA
jgi:hypothetical protein